MRLGLFRARAFSPIAVTLFAAGLLITQPPTASRAYAAATPQGKGGTIKPVPTPTPAVKKTTQPRRSAATSGRGGAARSNPNSMSGADETKANERVFWESIRSSTDPEDFREYLRKYPEGEFAGLAKNRLNALEAPAKAEAAKKEEAKSKEEEAKKEEARRKDEAAKAEAEAKSLEVSREEIDLRASVRANPNDGNTHRNLGYFLSGQRRWADAEAEFREALRLFPAEPSYVGGFTKEIVVEPLVRVLTEQEKYTEAEIELRASVQRKPGDGKRHYDLGFFLQNQKRWADAEPAYREAVRLDPLALYVNQLTEVLVRQKKNTDAEIEWRAHLKRKPDDDNAYYYFGNFLSQQGKRAEAEAAFREAIRLKPDTSYYRLSLGEVLSKQGKLAEAEATYREALRLNPSDNSIVSGLVYYVLITQKKYSEADAEWRAHIRRKPDDYQRHWYFGSVLSAQRRWAEAETAYREALRLNPDHYDSAKGLTTALGKQNKWTAAESVYRRLIDAKPKESWRHRELGNVFAAQKKWAEADAEFKAALRLSPGDASVQAALADSLSKQGKWKEAEAAYREAMKVSLSKGYYERFLGKLFGEQNRWAEAETAFREVIRLSGSDNAYYHNELALALQKQSKLTEAETEYKKAEELVRKWLQEWPESPSAHNDLGLTLEGQKRLTEAEASFKEAARLDPDNEEYQKSLRRVTEALKKKP